MIPSFFFLVNISCSFDSCPFPGCIYNLDLDFFEEVSRGYEQRLDTHHSYLYIPSLTLVVWPHLVSFPILMSSLIRLVSRCNSFDKLYLINTNTILTMEPHPFHAHTEELKYKYNEAVRQLREFSSNE